MTPCVVVVPGLIGSVLELNGEEIWPGSVLDTFITRYDKLDKLLDPAARPTDLIRRVFVSKQYETLLGDLARCGFDENGPKPTLFPCPYDWRRRNEDSAATLADVVDRAAAAHVDADIMLIGHSMGGLVARYYLETPFFNARPGFAKVTRLVTLGAPHFGAPKALTGILGMEREAFLAPDQVKILANDERYPSAYQLLPPLGQPFAWNADASTRFAPVNIYGDDVAHRLGLFAPHLAAARDFHSALDPAKAPVPYFCFVGTRQSTVALVRINLKAEDIENKVVRMESEDSGDGTVPTWSAGLPRVQALTVGGEHGTLYKDGALRRTLATLLGKDGLLAPGDEIELALRERVVGPEEPVHGVLTFRPRPALAGELRFERATDASGTAWVPSGKVLHIQYSGLTAQSIGLVFNAPGVRGVYRVSFFPEGAVSPEGQDELFVQSGT